MDTSQNAAAQDLSAARSRSRNAKNNIACGGTSTTEESVADTHEVEEKIVALQRIVPGGERLPVEELFEETAEYIHALENQVKALRFLAAFVQSSDKKKRKLGG